MINMQTLLSFDWSVKLTLFLHYYDAVVTQSVDVVCFVPCSTALSVARQRALWMCFKQ